MEKEKAEIASLVERYGRVQSLMKYVNSDTLKESYNKQPKGKAVGVDGITKEQYGENLEENIESLLVRMKKFSYKPYPVRRAYIPKGNGKMRGLGIPSGKDCKTGYLRDHKHRYLPSGKSGRQRRCPESKNRDFQIPEKRWSHCVER